MFFECFETCLNFTECSWVTIILARWGLRNVSSSFHEVGWCCCVAVLSIVIIFNIINMLTKKLCPSGFFQSERSVQSRNPSLLYYWSTCSELIGIYAYSTWEALSRSAKKLVWLPDTSLLVVSALGFHVMSQWVIPVYCILRSISNSVPVRSVTHRPSKTYYSPTLGCISLHPPYDINYYVLLWVKPGKLAATRPGVWSQTQLYHFNDLAPQRSSVGKEPYCKDSRSNSDRQHKIINGALVRTAVDTTSEQIQQLNIDFNQP